MWMWLMKLPDSVFVNCYRWRKFPLMWLKAVKQKKKPVGTNVLSVAKPFIRSPCWRTTAKRFMARSEYTFVPSAIRPLNGQHISRYLVITVDCSLNSFSFKFFCDITKRYLLALCLCFPFTVWEVCIWERESKW